MLKYTLLFFFTALLLCNTTAFTQANIEVEGGVAVGDSEGTTPEPGTVRWTGADLEGWNGVIWASLTGDVFGTVSDINGNVYKTQKLGENTWMIENLRTRNFNDGSFISDYILDAGWAAATIPARCRYENSNSNIIPYGYLYNGFAIEDDRLCPSDWHVPQVVEWEALIDVFGGEAIAAGSLKEAGTAHWSSPNTGATNDSGFSALPGGNRSPDGSFTNLHRYGNYWSLDLIGLHLKDYNFEYNAIDVTQLTFTQKQWGVSVRCVKDN